MYTIGQIQAAKENAKLHGIQLPISDEQAAAFLSWYFANNVEYNSVMEAAAYGIRGLDTTGYNQQIAKWQEILGE